MTTGHRHEFDSELDAISSKVTELFAMLAEDLPRATQALISGENEILQVLAEREKMTDALYREIEELVSREILLQAPVASDLRFLLSVLRMVPEIERSHDLVMHIASQADHVLGSDLTGRAQGLVERLGKVVGQMWSQAADAWRQRDSSALLLLTDRLVEVHELDASLIAELASGRLALPVAMEMAQVARDYKRLGAHAVNVARKVAYLAGSSTEP